MFLNHFFWIVANLNICKAPSLCGGKCHNNVCSAAVVKVSLQSSAVKTEQYDNTKVFIKHIYPTNANILLHVPFIQFYCWQGCIFWIHSFWRKEKQKNVFQKGLYAREEVCREIVPCRKYGTPHHSKLLCGCAIQLMVQVFKTEDRREDMRRRRHKIEESS